MKEEIKVVYDGDCPICARYVLYSKLREEFKVTITDARTSPELVQFYKENHDIDLNDGMVVEVDGAVLYGAEAFSYLEEIVFSTGLLRGGLRKLLGEAGLIRLYPWLVKGRKALLRMLRRERLR